MSQALGNSSIDKAARLLADADAIQERPVGLLGLETGG